MITREALLAQISRALSDDLGVPDNQVTTYAANKAFKLVYLNVIIPMLDAFEFDARPVYRELLISQIRDIVIEPEEISASRDEIKQDMQVHDDI